MDTIGRERAMSVPPRHMPALDGFRGFALALMLCCHANLFIGLPATDSWVDNFRYLVLGSGWIGMNMFFVLSGFLITGILLATKTSSDFFKSFYVRRVLRISPLYYLYVLAAIAITMTTFTRWDRLSLLLFFYNFRAISLGHHLRWVNSLWSVAVEEQFYLIWPILIAVLSRRTLKYFCTAGIIFALVFRICIFPNGEEFQTTYYSTLCRMDDLFIGAMLALCRSEEGFEKKMRRFGARMAVAILCGLFAIAMWTGHFMNFVTFKETGIFRHSSVLILGPGMTLLSLLSAIVVAKCWHQNRVNRIFLFRPLRLLGKYSYGMYMSHWPLLILIHRVLRRAKMMHIYVHPYVILPAIFLLSYGAGYLSFHAYEKHFLRLKRFFPAI